MNRNMKLSALMTTAVLLSPTAALAEIPGIVGKTAAEGCAVDRCFSLTAKPGRISLGDGNQLLIWGFSDDDAPIMAGGAAQPQYPGPTLFAVAGERVQVTLHNGLSRKSGAGSVTPPASLVFPGQGVVATSGGVAGPITSEAVGTGDTVTYTFTAANPGTFLYQSGSQPELQVEMGLVGGLIVRPNVSGKLAYNGAGSAYDREYLYLLTEIDRAAHEAVEFGNPIDPSTFKATLWFINGRNGPDTLVEAPEGDTHTSAGVGWFPYQPYNALTRLQAGERVLGRLINAGTEMHPFHHHGNNAWVIARDGHVMESAVGAEQGYPDFQYNHDTGASPSATLPDESVSNYTIQTVPGATYDFIWTWTGRDLNWDPYGLETRYLLDANGAQTTTVTHRCAAAGEPDVYMPGEDKDSHCKGLPVTLPENQSLTLGGLWSGSPELGIVGALPPGEGGLNPAGGYTFMWHSHNERELTNDDVFPGGMMTMVIVEAPGQLTPEPAGHLVQP